MAGPEDAERQPNSAYVEELNTWKKLHVLGRAQVDPGCLLPPDVSWAARERKEQHVQNLMQSFLSEMTVNKNIVAVLDINTLQDYPEKQARAREIMRLRLVNPKHEVAEAAGFDGEEEMFKFAESCGLETLCGDHSRCAIFNLSHL